MTCSCPKGWCYQRRDCRRVEPAVVAAELIQDAARDLGLMLPAPAAIAPAFTGKRFEIAADAPEMSLAAMVEAVRIEPELSFSEIIERRRKR